MNTRYSRCKKPVGFATKLIPPILLAYSVFGICVAQNAEAKRDGFFHQTKTYINGGYVTLPTQTVFPEETTLHIVFPAETPEPVVVTDAERTMLLQIGMSEAGSVGVECMACVMRTVLNRVDDEWFPDNIHDVIFQKGQFTPTEDGGYFMAIPSEQCELALEMVLSGWDNSDGALYFESCSDPDNWHSRNLEFLYQIGPMRFYR